MHTLCTFFSFYSQSGDNQKSCKKMFIGGVADGTTDEMLKEAFAEYGEMTSADVIVDKSTGKVKGFAFIEFVDYDSVDRAVCKYQHVGFSLIVLSSFRQRE